MLLVLLQSALLGSAAAAHFKLCAWTSTNCQGSVECQEFPANDCTEFAQSFITTLEYPDYTTVEAYEGTDCTTGTVHYVNDFARRREDSLTYCDNGYSTDNFKSLEYREMDPLPRATARSFEVCFYTDGGCSLGELCDVFTEGTVCQSVNETLLFVDMVLDGSRGHKVSYTNNCHSSNIPSVSLYHMEVGQYTECLPTTDLTGRGSMRVMGVSVEAPSTVTISVGEASTTTTTRLTLTTNTITKPIPTTETSWVLETSTVTELDPNYSTVIITQSDSTTTETVETTATTTLAHTSYSTETITSTYTNTLRFTEVITSTTTERTTTTEGTTDSTSTESSTTSTQSETTTTTEVPISPESGSALGLVSGTYSFVAILAIVVVGHF